MLSVRRTVITLIGAMLWLAPVAQADDGNSTFLNGSTQALILGPTGIPTPDASYIGAAEHLYLGPDGFSGDAIALTTPETGDFGASVTAGEADLVRAVEAAYNSGSISADDPLTIMTYSQSSVIASLAEQQLYEYGIPSADLHFVMLGDTSSAEGGFLNTFGDTTLGQEVLNMLGYDNIVGAVTPNDLYPTDVYTISGDGWADWANGANIAGMFSTHLEYFGLTAQEIANATVTADGLTDYYTIANPGLEALFTALGNISGML